MWDKIEFYCGVDGARMVLDSNGRSGLYYRCPQADFSYRSKVQQGKACKNNLSMLEADSIYEAVEKKYYEGTLQPGVAFSLRYLDIKIGQIYEDMIKVFVVNHRVKQNRRRKGA